MQKVSLEALARQQLSQAAASGRNAADTVVGGHEKVLRQTVIGMTSGSEMGEHENPGEATLYVLSGSVRLSAGGQQWDARTGDLLLLPDSRHSLLALADSALLLTVAKLG
ncbi:quercetin dioxygenase-like cupin family protein [Mycolicibacterium iranicum]|uniref:Quercetin dioxygenase-like cupin family protein n=1 Tax=Mycolicibacterium iranicum TaxID=912594 RepID=A0A839QFE8_MYCIR|nr:cupin domain-containing protein [Mycolicibacterium iranicum]MBB2992856.1 quercetin dioxygenase-like cupin family protein [Mycolicibacterium iranicum]